MKRSSAHLKHEVENPVGMRLYAYRNLHRDCFSLMDSRGRVVKHVESVLLNDVEFRVRPGGFRKVQETGQRVVHAFAIGLVTSVNDFEVLVGQKVSYNPKKGKSYFVNESGNPVNGTARAALVMEDGHGKAYYGVSVIKKK